MKHDATHGPATTAALGWQRLAWMLLVLLLSTLGALAFVAQVALRGLQPQPGEWTLHLGAWSRPLSAPVLLRWSTHPLLLPLLDGRSLSTAAGRWRIHVDAGQRVQAVCSPCTLRLKALGPAPLTLDRVQLDAQRAGPEAWAGTLRLGSDGRAAAVAWQARLQRDGLALSAKLEPTAIAPMLATLGQALPESRRARIEGRFGFEATALYNQDGFTALRVRPHLDGVAVDGLGTEALIDAALPSRCAGGGNDIGRIDGWLPRAVIAAEDQRFYRHAGYDLDEALAAWRRNQDRADPDRGATPGALRGASTITQQLAKILYTGDERSAARKLREWLYAVEMERTLGKARILQLYLGSAPWGEVCGAQAAARRYLGKDARTLQPHEAAWLAGLLTRPAAQVARARAEGRVDATRTARVIAALRPLPPGRRQAQIERLDGWQPAFIAPPPEP